MDLEKYNSELSYSYIFGAFGTIELLKNRPELCQCVLVDPSFVNNDSFKIVDKICKERKIAILVDLKLISKIRDKGNIFVIGVFKKETKPLANEKHIILYNVNDGGKVGTIIRSMTGFNFKNLALVSCNVDLFNEHLIRSSMGAFFKTNIEVFSSMDSYNKQFCERTIYAVGKEGNSLESVNISNKTSILFSEGNNNEKGLIPIGFEADIPLDNIVNIVLFSVYHK